MKKIGMRNFKTTFSIFICLLLFKTINRDNSFFACIAAVICMQDTVVNSMEKGIARVIGTIIGGLAGALVLYFGNSYFNDNILIFVIPLGIMALIHICVTINMKQSTVICCVVYLSVMITKNHDNGYLLYTINRIIDTSIGILIAVLVNKYIKLPESFSPENISQINKYEESDKKVITDEESEEGLIKSHNNDNNKKIC